MALGKYYEDNCELAEEYYKNLQGIVWWTDPNEQSAEEKSVQIRPTE